MAALVALVLSLCMALVILVARQQPLPPPLAMLHLTDCAPPCWIGITPGVTPADQVRARIDAVYSDALAYRVVEPESATVNIHHIQDLKSAAVLTVQWSAEPQNTLKWLVISSTSDVDLADLSNLMGVPLGVQSLNSTGNPVPGLLYRKTIVDVWSSPTKYLRAGKAGLQDKIASIIFTTDDFSQLPFERWRGFEIP